jgi:hypothetical protein
MGRLPLGRRLDFAIYEIYRGSTPPSAELFLYCLILGFATEYSTSVRKFTAT